MPRPKPPFLLTPAQLRRLSPHFPLSHGVPRVDDRRVLSGIIYVIRNGLQWRAGAQRGRGCCRCAWSPSPLTVNQIASRRSKHFGFRS